MMSRGVPWWLSRGCPVHGVWSRGPVVPWSTGRAQANDASVGASGYLHEYAEKPDVPSPDRFSADVLSLV
jgi:hypothetical protein